MDSHLKIVIAQDVIIKQNSATEVEDGGACRSLSSLPEAELLSAAQADPGLLSDFFVMWENLPCLVVDTLAAFSRADLHPPPAKISNFWL